MTARSQTQTLLIFVFVIDFLIDLLKAGEVVLPIIIGHSLLLVEILHTVEHLQTPFSIDLEATRGVFIISSSS